MKFMRSSGQRREKINLTVLERFSSERKREREREGEGKRERVSVCVREKERDVNFWTQKKFLQNKLKVEQTFEYISH